MSLAQWLPQLSLRYDTFLSNYSHALLNSFAILSIPPNSALMAIAYLLLLCYTNILNIKYIIFCLLLQLW